MQSLFNYYTTILPNYIDLTKNLRKIRHLFTKQISMSPTATTTTTATLSVLIPVFRKNILKLSTKFANIFSDISDNDSNFQYYIINQPTYKNGSWISASKK